MEGEQPEKAVDLSAVKTADLVRELKARFVEIQKAQVELGMDTIAPVTARPRTTKVGTVDRRSGEKSPAWRLAQAERWLKSAKARGDKAGIQKYEQRVKELKKSAHAGGD